MVKNHLKLRMLGRNSLENENILVKSHLEIRKSEQEGFGVNIPWKMKININKTIIVQKNIWGGPILKYLHKYNIFSVLHMLSQIHFKIVECVKRGLNLAHLMLHLSKIQSGPQFWSNSIAETNCRRSILNTYFDWWR